MGHRAVAGLLCAALLGAGCGDKRDNAARGSPAPARERRTRSPAADAGDRTRVRAAAGRAARQHRRPGPLGDGRLPRRSGLVRRGRRRRHRAAAADDHPHRDGVRQRHQDGHGRARAATRRAGRARARRSHPPLVPGVARRPAGDGARPARPYLGGRRPDARSASKRSCAIHGATSRGASWRRRPSPVRARARPCTRTRASSIAGLILERAPASRSRRPCGASCSAIRAARASRCSPPSVHARRGRTRTGTPTAGPSRPTPRDGGPYIPNHTWANVPVAAGALAGDVPSLARWAHGLLGGRDPGAAVAARR